MDDVVNSFVPTVSEDCGTVLWSHPAFKGGFGEPNGYLLYVNGGPAQPYTPGDAVVVAEGGEPWQVTLKATYDGMSFEHQLGQHKGVGEVCEVVPGPVEPDVPEVPEEVVADVPALTDDVATDTATESVVHVPVPPETVDTGIGADYTGLSLLVAVAAAGVALLVRRWVS